ncbi:MAG: FHA domain-containing protein [Deltaproteobacteria bacterium]|nr:FHA domain-containing protein [Deltaproteobacteria bacterium]
MFYVAVRESGRLVAHVPIAGTRATVGRSATNDVVILRSQVSARHAQIILGPRGFEVVDLKSTNGTWVNGTRVTGAAPVRPGERVRIAHFTLELRPDPLPDGVAFFNLLDSESPAVDITTTEMDLDEVPEDPDKP